MVSLFTGSFFFQIKKLKIEVPISCELYGLNFTTWFYSNICFRWRVMMLTSFCFSHLMHRLSLGTLYVFSVFVWWFLVEFNLISSMMSFYNMIYNRSYKSYISSLQTKNNFFFTLQDEQVMHLHVKHCIMPCIMNLNWYAFFSVLTMREMCNSVSKGRYWSS